MAEENSDRTHPASPIQLNQARAAGDIPRSIELAAAIHNFGGLIVLALCGATLVTWLGHWTTSTWATPFSPETPQLLDVGRANVMGLASQLFLPLSLLLLFAIAGFWLQTGFYFKPERIALDPAKLGLRRLQNQNGKVQFFKFLLMLPKLGIGISLVALLLWQYRLKFFELATSSPEKFWEDAIGLTLWIGFLVAATLFLFAVLDYVFERMGHQERWEMTEQQIRDEERLENGNPTTRRHRQQFRKELSERSTLPD